MRSCAGAEPGMVERCRKLAIEGFWDTPETIKGTDLGPGREAQEVDIDVKNSWCVVWEEH